MSYESKLFKKIPYSVRDSESPIYSDSELEKYLVTYFGSKEKVLEEVVSIFHDDKNEGNIVNIETKNTKDEIWYGDDNCNICLRITVQFKRKRKIGSHDVEDLLIKWNEPDLWNAFRGIVGCDGKIIFPSIDAKTYGEDRFEEKRRIIELKKDVIIKLAKEFDLDTSPLFEALNIANENIIKKTCKELGLTYSQLGEVIGVKEQSLRNMSSSNKITEQVEQSINLLIENYKLKEQLKDCNILKEALKNLIK